VAGTDAAEIQYVAVAAARPVLTVDITVGTRLPASRTALGRALLGRDEPGGYALADEELESGLRSIAVPVRDRAGRAVAARQPTAGRRGAVHARTATVAALSNISGTSSSSSMAVRQRRWRPGRGARYSTGPMVISRPLLADLPTPLQGRAHSPASNEGNAAAVIVAVPAVPSACPSRRIPAVNHGP
jgi:hypothetical protein